MPQDKIKGNARQLRHGEGSWWEDILAQTKAIRHMHMDNSVRTIKEFRRNRGRVELFSQRDPGLNEFGLMDAYPPTPPDTTPRRQIAVPKQLSPATKEIQGTALQERRGGLTVKELPAWTNLRPERDWDFLVDFYRRNPREGDDRNWKPEEQAAYDAFEFINEDDAVLGQRSMARDQTNVQIQGPPFAGKVLKDLPERRPKEKIRGKVRRSV